MTASLVPHLTHLILLFPYSLSFGGFVDGTDGKKGVVFKILRLEKQLEVPLEYLVQLPRLHQVLDHMVHD